MSDTNKKYPVEQLKRQGQIIERGKGKYLVRIYLGRFPNEAGEMKRKYFSQMVRGTRQDAEAFVAEQLKTVRAERRLRGTANQLVSEYLYDFFHEMSEASRRTRMVDWSKVKNYVLPTIGLLRLKDINSAHIMLLYKMLKTRVSDKTGQPLSATTRSNVHRILKTAFGHAQRNKLVPQNLFDGVVAPKPMPREFNVLTPEEAKNFLRACENNRDAQANRKHFLKNIVGPIFHLALETGMRPEEYMALKRDDISFDASPLGEALVRVRRALVRYNNTSEWEFVKTKTAASRRGIPLSPGLARKLKQHFSEVDARRAERRDWQDYNLVFPTNNGGPLHDDPLRNLFKENIRLAGLNPKEYRLYDLRHTCATLLFLKREHPKVAQQRLGHSGVAITLDTYSHFVPSMQEEATRKLSEMLYSEEEPSTAALKIGTTQRLRLSQAEEIFVQDLESEDN